MYTSLHKYSLQVVILSWDYKVKQEYLSSMQSSIDIFLAIFLNLRGKAFTIKENEGGANQTHLGIDVNTFSRKLS